MMQTLQMSSNAKILRLLSLYYFAHSNQKQNHGLLAVFTSTITVPPNTNLILVTERKISGYAIHSMCLSPTTSTQSVIATNPYRKHPESQRSAVRLYQA